MATLVVHTVTTTCIRISESWQNGKNHKKITGKTVRPSAKVKTFTNVNQSKKQNICVAFCSNNYLASYVRSTVYILTLKKIGSSTNETHQQIALGISIPFGSKTQFTTVLKLAILAGRRQTAKIAFPYHVFLSTAQ